MRQVLLKCPYCLKEGYVPIDRLRKFINRNQIEEPVSLPCGPCAAARAGQSPQDPRRNHRLWNWFDRLTRHSLVVKIIVAMTPVTLALVLIGFMTDVTQRLGAYHSDEVHLILMILLFCEGIFLLGLFVRIPYDYSCNVVTNPAFDDLEENAWHEREISQS